MSKPRLCEILGVEVNERFKIVGSSYTGMLYVNEGGYLDGDDDYLVDVDTLCVIINNPYLIIHKSKWTQQDIEDAKAIKRLMPWVHRIGRDQFGAVYVGSDSLTQIDASCFKDLKQDEEIELDEILNSEEHWKKKVLSDE